MRKTTRMSRAFNAYARQAGIPFIGLRFLLDGSQLHGDETPESLRLDDGDCIDCLREQLGG
jgi:Ubiquitin-2 like Rad60 SUMO-like